MSDNIIAEEPPFFIRMGRMLLADKFALQELCAKYSRAVDRRDFALLRNLYHDDSTDEHGNMFAGGGEDFVDYVSRTVTQFECTVHYITNMIFAVDGTFQREVDQAEALRPEMPTPALPLDNNGRFWPRG